CTRTCPLSLDRPLPFFLHVLPSSAIYTLSLHDALPICFCVQGQTSVSARRPRLGSAGLSKQSLFQPVFSPFTECVTGRGWTVTRSEEHTSELQSRENLVCRLLLEKKKHKREKPSQPTIH